MTVGGEVQKTLRRRALTGDDAPAAYFGRCVHVCGVGPHTHTHTHTYIYIYIYIYIYFGRCVHVCGVGPVERLGRVWCACESIGKCELDACQVAELVPQLCLTQLRLLATPRSVSLT